MAAKKTIKYTEPIGYFPKELRDKIIKAGELQKKSSKATGSKKK